MCLRLPEHPTGRVLTSDLSAKSFILVVYENYFKVQSEFLYKRLTKIFQQTTIIRPVRSECSSCRVLRKNRGASENNVSILRFRHLRAYAAYQPKKLFHYYFNFCLVSLAASGECFPATVFLSLIICRLKLFVLVTCVARVKLCLRLQDVEIRRLRTGRQFTTGVPTYRILERHLLSVCFISLVAYRAFCIIAAVSQDETAPPSDPNQKDELILLLGNYGNPKLVQHADQFPM